MPWTDKRVNEQNKLTDKPTDRYSEKQKQIGRNIGRQQVIQTYRPVDKRSKMYGGKDGLDIFENDISLEINARKQNEEQIITTAILL